MTGGKVSLLRWPWRLQQLAWITLLSLTSKVLSRIILQCITKAVENIYYAKSRSVLEKEDHAQITYSYYVRQILEQSREWNTVYAVLILKTLRRHLTAYTAIESLWKSLRHYHWLRHSTETGSHHPVPLWELRMPSDPQQPACRALRSEHLSQSPSQWTLEPNKDVFCHLCFSTGSWGMLHKTKDRIAVDTDHNPRGPGPMAINWENTLV